MFIMVAVAPTCFVCTGQIPPNFLQNSDENSSLLCEFLEIPHLVNNGGIRYCPGCAHRIVSIRDMFEELERLEKNLLNEKYLIENQLKENSRKENAQMNCSTDEMRIRVGAELTAKTVQLIMKKIREKQVGQTVNTKRPVRIMKNVTITKTPTLKNGRSCQNSGEIFQTELPTPGRKSDILLSQESAIYYHESLPLEDNLEVQSNSGTEVLEDPLQINTCQVALTVSDFDVDIDIKHERNPYVLDAQDDFHVGNLVVASEFITGTSTESVSNSIKSEVGRQFGVTKFTDAQRTDEGNTKTYICGTCGISFDRYNQLLIHDRVHMQDVCSSTVSNMPKNTDATLSKNNRRRSNTQRRRKNLKVWPSLRPKKCEECGRILSTHLKWRHHVMQMHRKEHKFKCPFCDFGCQQKSDFDRHKLVHSEKRSFKCHLCHKAFKQKRGLTGHFKSHK